MSRGPSGVLVMAYGTASGPDDIERYYTDIRGGRAPSPEHLAELAERYRAIGNVFPLLETTRAQADGLATRLNADGRDRFRVYVGMKHSPPFIPEAVERMRADGVERGIGIVMAPHWSGMSVETYLERVQVAAEGGGPAFTFVRHYHDHPMFVAFLADRVAEVLDRLSPEARASATVLFTAHSLPVRNAADGSLRCTSCDCDHSCRYHDGLQETADLVAERLGLGVDDCAIAWQSAGRTQDPWWGPPVVEVIPQLAAGRRSAVVICSAGFVADHLETLFDLDIEARAIAEEVGITFARTRMPNADPDYLDVLAQIVRDHLVEVRV